MGSTETAAQDLEDMRRLADGHDAALNSLMERHAGPVFQFLLRMLGNEEDANDLAQETFARVYGHRNRFDGAKFTNWLYTIAANLARSEYRRRCRHPNVSLEAEWGTEGSTLGETLKSQEPTPIDLADATERHRTVRQAVDQLAPELREAVILCEWEEMSVADAAAVLNTTKKAVESRLYRARIRLREQLSKWLLL